MTLTAIALMLLAALLVWLVPARRFDLLLIISIFALFALQSEPSAYALALPTLTITLVVGTWWLVTANPSPADVRTLIGIAAITFLSAVIFRFSLDLVLRFIPAFACVGLTAVGVRAMLPAASLTAEASEAGRRRLALLLILGIVGLFVILKIPALQAVVSTSISPSLPLNWAWLGFSYIAFRLIHVLLDYRIGRLSAVSLRDFALYVVFFPAITAGPIARIEQFTAELAPAEPRTLDSDRLLSGFTRLGIGLFKKFVLADTLALISLNPTLVAQNHSAAVMWIMLYAYAFQLFFDFSGYIDMVIGIGRLAGITLPENFASPYTKRNLTAFWNSWHITLSTWARLYFFAPLSRTLMGTPLKRYKQLVIFTAQVSTMILIGLWHGVALNFILWGAWHGVGLWLNRYLTERSRGWDAFVRERPALARVVHGLSVLFTFHFVAIGWLFFALPSTSLIIKALRQLVGLPG